jgi:hypothetical protein
MSRVPHRRGKVKEFKLLMEVQENYDHELETESR